MTHEIKRNDFLILSTDGLFDNLYEDEIALIINNHINRSQQLEENPEIVGEEEELNASQNNGSSSFSHSTPFNLLKSSSKKNKISTNKKNKPITNELLNSTCDILVQKACNGIIILY